VALRKSPKWLSMYSGESSTLKVRILNPTSISRLRSYTLVDAFMRLSHAMTQLSLREGLRFPSIKPLLFSFQSISATTMDRPTFLHVLIIINFFWYVHWYNTTDIALHLIQHYRPLALASDKEKLSPLYALASMPYAFPSGSQLVFWKRWIYSCKHH
jgi:hypothetical protein